MVQQIQVRRGTAAAWTSANTLLAQGEEGFEIDTNKLKIGDGSTTWNSLPYFAPGGGGGGGTPANGGVRQTLGNSATNTPAWVLNVLNAGNPAFGNIYTDAQAAIQTAIDYCYANGIRQLYIPCHIEFASYHNITAPLFNDPPSNLRNGISTANQKLGTVATPSVFGLGLEIICEFGTRFYPTNNADGSGGVWGTAPIWWMGTQGSSRLTKAITVGPRNALGIALRAMDPKCTGIAIASGNGGATDTIIEDCSGYDVYNGITFGQNGENALAENNRILNCTYTAVKGVTAINGQSLVNMVIGGAFAGAYVSFDNIGQGLTIIGGEHGTLAPSAGVTINMTTSGTLTGFSDALPGSGSPTMTNYHIDCVMGSGAYPQLADGTFYYNAGLINLPNYPYVPVEQTGWNAGTSTATYKINVGWLFHNFGEELALSGTTFATELAAATQIMLAPRAYLARGLIDMYRSHCETNSSLALYDGRGGSGTFRNLETGNWHLYLATDTVTSYTNLIFPWVTVTGGGFIARDWTMPPDAEINGVPFVIQFFDQNSVGSARGIISGCSQFANANMRYVGKDLFAAQQRGPCFPDPDVTYTVTGTKAFGGWEWDYDYWSVSDANTISNQALAGMIGTRRSPYIGYRPAPYINPRITTADVAAVVAKSSAPNICGNTQYQIAQKAAADITTMIDVGGSGSTDYTSASIDWNCIAGSVFVNLPTNNANARRYLYNGREIVLSLAGTPTTFIVDGCYLTLATGLSIAGMNFISVKLASTSASVIPGTVGTAYSGSTITSRDPVLSFPAQLRKARVSTQFDKTSSTALANITGLSKNVFAGRSYSFRACLFTTSNIAGGVQVAIGGTATATATIYEGEATDPGGTQVSSRTTTLGNPVAAVTAVTAARIDICGEITVNATGTLTVQFAQNASNGSASSVLVGSWFEISEIP